MCEIPGVTQVDEKGHEGNTAVVTAYLGWRKHGKKTALQEFLLTTFSYSEHYIILIPQSC